jgi:hypothetical protein
LFEFLVIKKSLAKKSTLYLEEGEAVTIPNILERFDGITLPEASSDSVTYVPIKQNFPAIYFFGEGIAAHYWCASAYFDAQEYR